MVVITGICTFRAGTQHQLSRTDQTRWQASNSNALQKHAPRMHQCYATVI